MEREARSEPVVVRLEIGQGEPIRGTASTSASRSVFAGWMELVTAIERARTGAPVARGDERAGGAQ